MNGSKFLAGTAALIVAVLLGLMVVLGEFNLMVYPSRITAVSLYTVEKGVCQVEFLGEKAQFSLTDLENTFQTIKIKSMAAGQSWNDWFKALLLEYKFERCLNILKKDMLLPFKDRLEKGITGVCN